MMMIMVIMMRVGTKERQRKSANVIPRYVKRNSEETMKMIIMMNLRQLRTKNPWEKLMTILRLLIKMMMVPMNKQVTMKTQIKTTMKLSPKLLMVMMMKILSAAMIKDMWMMLVVKRAKKTQRSPLLKMKMMQRMRKLFSISNQKVDVFWKLIILVMILLHLKICTSLKIIFPFGIYEYQASRSYVYLRVGASVQLQNIAWQIHCPLACGTIWEREQKCHAYFYDIC